MSATAFGDHLKREREMRGVSLEEISAATRISTRFLQALENEQWSALPGGIFNRGFIRAEAHFLGLDEESLLAEYALATNDRPEVAVAARMPALPRQGTLPAIVFAVVLVVVLVAWLAYRRVAPHMRTARPAAPQASAKDPGANPPSGSSPAAGSHATPASNSSAAAGDPATNTADALELKVEAGKSAQVSITSDGASVFSGELSPGDSRHFQAHESFEISSSDASAVLLELNGQIQPPLGTPGHPGRATLTRRDLKKRSGGHD